MSKSILRSIVVLAALGAVLIAGCGGGDEEESLTKTEYVRKGNAICGKWQQARGDLFRQLNRQLKPPVTQARKEKAILLILEPFETATDELADLPLPEGDEKNAEAVVKAMEGGIAQSKANPGSLLSSGVTFQKSNELAENYGLTECTV